MKRYGLFYQLLLVIVLSIFGSTFNAHGADEEEAKYWFKKGLSYFDSAQYDKAVEAFSKILDLNFRFAQVYVSRGISWSKKGEYDRSISDYTKALEINPHLDQAFYNRGVAWSQKDNFDHAIHCGK